MDVSRILDQARFFEGISKESKQALSRFCMPGERPKHTTLFREDEPGEAMYLLARGRVSLHKLTPEGRVLVAFLRGGGKLQRPGDDGAVLRLGARLSKWMGIESPPFQFTPRRVRWDAMFECRSLRAGPGS
jgi:CRP-like cAMP-binding protein